MDPDKLAGKPSPRLIQGTEFFKDWEASEAMGLLDAAFAAGLRAFDTAHDYGKGHCETLLGQWLERRGCREQVIVITKCAHPWDSGSRVTAAAVAADLAESLERLRVPSVDILLLHRDDPATDVAQLMAALHAQVTQKRCAAIGASNWSHERLAAANRFATSHGLTPFTYASPHFSLAVPSRPPWPGCISIAGREGVAARQWYRRQRLPVLAWAALSSGYLAAPSDGGENVGVSELARLAFGTPENVARRRRLHELAGRKGVPPVALALAYLCSQPFDVWPIVSPRNAAEIAGCLPGVSLRLSPTERSWLDGEDDA